jgi:hypothetical protein
LIWWSPTQPEPEQHRELRVRRHGPDDRELERDDGGFDREQQRDQQHLNASPTVGNNTSTSVAGIISGGRGRDKVGTHPESFSGGAHPRRASWGRLRQSEHFQEKWPPVFRGKCDQTSNLDRIPIARDRNPV